MTNYEKSGLAGIHKLITSKAIATRSAYTSGYGEEPDRNTIGDWDSTAWNEDYAAALQEWGYYREEMSQEAYEILYAIWDDAFFDGD